MLSMFFTKRILINLSNKGANISSALVGNVLQGSILDIERHTVQNLIYSTTSSVTAITLGIISSCITIVSEIALLFLIACGLFLEATSALDAETEHTISASIEELKGQTTIIIVAHRLSTVENADIVVYLSDGKIIAQGNFDQVRSKVPEFDSQAKLMGL